MTEEQAIEIDLCPFCSHKSLKVTGKTQGRYEQRHMSYQVLCNTCWARGPLVAHDKERAVEFWNRRRKS